VLEASQRANAGANPLSRPASPRCNEGSAPLSGAILIVEDHPFVADATAGLLHYLYPAAPLILANCAEAALSAVTPQMFRVFLDLQIPGAVGTSLLRALCDRIPAARCCVVTANDDSTMVRAAAACGVLGYILKSQPVEDFKAAIDSIMAGRPTFPAIAGAAMRIEPRLSGRQIEVVRQVSAGLSNKQIAFALGISEGTVKNHIQMSARELNVNNRMQLVRRAVELGLIEER
jgi:DNA-binding NarL/FixJ family response regulator